MPRNYNNCKIYKIVSLSQPDKVYYGHTCNTLHQRMTSHRAVSNATSSRSVIDCGDAVILLVEEYPCKNKMEAKAKEAEYIIANPCVNKSIPNRTQEQYKIDNREQILEQKNTKCKCLCGGSYSQANKAHHLTTQKHQEYLKKLENPPAAPGKRGRPRGKKAQAIPMTQEEKEDIERQQKEAEQRFLKIWQQEEEEPRPTMFLNKDGELLFPIYQYSSDDETEKDPWIMPLDQYLAQIRKQNYMPELSDTAEIIKEPGEIKSSVQYYNMGGATIMRVPWFSYDPNNPPWELSDTAEIINETLPDTEEIN